MQLQERQETTYSGPALSRVAGEREPLLGDKGLGSLRTALVHDDLVQAGGAERVAAAFYGLFPRAPMYTALYNPRTTLADFAGRDIRTSYLQRTPFSWKPMHQLALPYFPGAIEQFDLSGYDLVLSSSSRFAKGVITNPETCHICYCHTPARFAWRSHDYLSRSWSARLAASFGRKLLTDLRSWDENSAQRVDYFIANSYNIARRIKKRYRRDVAAVIPPPVEISRFSPIAAEHVGRHFLVVSRLVGYKRVDLAIEACNRLGLDLRIVGDGPEMARLRKIAGPTIEFLGRLDDKQVESEYARCRALIFPGEEDFGLTPLEAMASGRPVVAYGGGGAVETVIDGETGVLFSEQSVDSLAGALRSAMSLATDAGNLRSHAARFGRDVFEARLAQFIEAALAEHRRYFGPAGKRLISSGFVVSGSW
jgi:glycosyltransferase involved in cell wall biosynthesis